MIAEAVSSDGLPWLIVAAILAGLVRGFSGFGTAMVYLPVAGQVMPPVAALTTLIVMDFFGPLPLLPRALRHVERGELARLALGLAVGLPLGVLVLTAVPADAFRYAVSVLSLLLLAALTGGLRYPGAFTPRLLFGTGGVSGFLAGSVGLGGPPVIMLYMASTRPAPVIRATVLVYLLLTDVGMLIVLGLAALLAPTAVIVGLLLVVPYALSAKAGEAIFRPEAETLYRRVAYAIIAVSALSGLPLFD